MAPAEFGRVAERELPLPEGEKRIGVTFILNAPNGTQRQTSFEEAQKMFAMFPIADTCEPPAEQRKSLPGPDSDSERFDPNRLVRSSVHTTPSG